MASGRTTPSCITSTRRRGGQRDESDDGSRRVSRSRHQGEWRNARHCSRRGGQSGSSIALNRLPESNAPNRFGLSPQDTWRHNDRIFDSTHQGVRADARPLIHRPHTRGKGWAPSTGAARGRACVQLVGITLATARTPSGIATSQARTSRRIGIQLGGKAETGAPRPWRMHSMRYHAFTTRRLTRTPLIHAPNQYTGGDGKGYKGGSSANGAAAGGQYLNPRGEAENEEGRRSTLSSLLDKCAAR
mmetsp:Transcript_12799/g.31937  ORF Transcript_12799/g.31937 Transcript_12799/m.31937 type:complete len:245 (-) Transcript_12799:121-855(-)